MTSWKAVRAHRLRRHLLAEPDPRARPVDAVRAMCGAHAQVLSAAEVSVAMRTPGGSRADVRQADGLVKTRGPRGTVHLLAADDLPIWTGALSAVPLTRFGGRDPLLTAEQAEQIVAAVPEVLASGALTADELTTALAAAVGSWAADPVMEGFSSAWPRWRQAEDIIMNSGAMVFGPHRGRKVTYVDAGVTPADPGEALPELVRHYLRAFGPATADHFARWLAAPRPWAAELFAGLGDRIRPVELDGWTGWCDADDRIDPDGEPGGVRLLPYFDSYTVGGQPRELLFPGAAASRALAGGQAGNYPVVLVDGVVAGVWHQRRSGRRIAVTVEPLVPIAEPLLEEQVARLGVILEGQATLTVGPVTVGAHA